MTNKGFTLIEMMIVVAIIGIVTALVAPTLMNTIYSSRTKGAANEVAFAIQSARSNSIMLGKYSQVVTSTDGTITINENCNSAFASCGNQRILNVPQSFTGVSIAAGTTYSLYPKGTATGGTTTITGKNTSYQITVNVLGNVRIQ